MSEAGRSFREDDADFLTRDTLECYRAKETRQLLCKCLLHVCDICNPTKPFRICRLWAWRLFEELFVQGDQEKAAGIPVQAMNDRDKVSRVYSQFGFIEFLAAPLDFTVMKLFPTFEPCVEKLMENIKSWQDVWIKEAANPPSEEERRVIEERISRLERRFLEEGG